MRALNYKTLALVLLFSSSFGFAQDTYNKKFHQSFDVNKESIFDINNKFGNIRIENTDADNITIDAEIVVKTRSQDKADKIMERITITIEKNGNTITALTEINNLKTNYASFEINYTVLMPAYLNLNLINKYGQVTINELHGKSKLAVKYGSLHVNKILDGNAKPLSSVELGYCDKSSIKEFNWGTLIIKYSKIEIEKGTALVVSSMYSQLQLGDFSSIIAEAGYDDYKFGTINNLVMEAKYSNIEINKLTKKLKIDNKYGDIEVGSIPKGFESIEVVSKYASIELGIAPDASYQLNASTSYADIKYPDIQISERVKGDFGTQIKGVVGNKAAKATVVIISEYGDIDLLP